MKNTLVNCVLLKTSFRFIQTALYSTKGHVLIGGGTGFIGRNLRELLLREKYEVTVLSRIKTGEKHIINWADLILNGLPKKHNCCGQFDCRVGSTMLLTDILNLTKCKPNVFITITSTDMYPSDGVHTEQFIPTNQMIDCNFFTKLGMEWEQASNNFPFRKISIRTGTVLGNDGGFLKCLKYLIAIGIGTRIGNGCQHQPWIHICDLLNLILFSIENKEVCGILNGVSPNCITNEELITIYTLMSKKPSMILNTPRILLKTIFGEERTQLILEGRKVLPTRTLESGFKFQYFEIEDALRNIKGR
ncbi:epimerase family protein SDR39U1-like [Melanaphis sacchari]|uniref:epimerase family protein SDR39U1-like n=1 Tax=Melanaphis sacchari TaxID=742174 RepID=UPI000DC14AD5|nr:epimerase family protein SDR39U1-like [Melanaphis sacchari]